MYFEIVTPQKKKKIEELRNNLVNVQKQKQKKKDKKMGSYKKGIKP